MQPFTEPSPPVTLTIDTVGGMAGPQITGKSAGSRDNGATVVVETIGESNSDRTGDSRARSLANLKPFKPGQSGNPNGRPKGVFRKYTKRHLLKEIAAGVRQIDCVVDSTIGTAIEGGSAGVAAFAALRDTVDGRPTAAADQSGDTQVTIEITMVGGQ